MHDMSPDMVETPDQGSSHEVMLAAKESAQHVKATVSEEAVRAMDNIRTVAREQIERQKGELTTSLRSVEQALRHTSSELENPRLAPQVERVADALHSAHQFLEQHQIEDMGVALRRLSLQHPVAFYSGIFALGFAAGRFLTASTQKALEPIPEIDLLEEDPAMDPMEQTLPEQVEQVVSHHGPY